MFSLNIYVYEWSINYFTMYNVLSIGLLLIFIVQRFKFLPLNLGMLPPMMCWGATQCSDICHVSLYHLITREKFQAVISMGLNFFLIISIFLVVHFDPWYLYEGNLCVVTITPARGGRCNILHLVFESILWL